MLSAELATVTGSVDEISSAADVGATKRALFGRWDGGKCPRLLLLFRIERATAGRLLDRAAKLEERP